MTTPPPAPPPAPAPPLRRTAEHTADLRAPADRAFRLIADVTRWPLLFPPCVAADVLESDLDSERIRLWAVVGEEVRSWTSLRTLDRERLRIDFRQEAPSPPVTWMGGHWEFARGADGESTTRLLLGHEWSTDGAPEQSELIARALDGNSGQEIGAVRSWAERPEPLEELVFSFEDRVEVDGPPEAVYDVLHRADLWPDRLPHVAAVELDTAAATPVTGGAEVQWLTMDTRAEDGSEHRTRSVRLCFPHRRIVYKQTTPPAGLLGHSGEWILTPHGAGTAVTAVHRVALDADALPRLFGPEPDLAAVRARVRAALGGNSLRTLEWARSFVAGAAAPASGAAR
ncbi:aromatase/cyclase [Kitasatospora sp. NPDC056184]|uniref:aromatase/cyclase n=1 Tax=Kitasatospora sp. NPDC056184 TaxID=3345738 RepID=UPI0035DD1022